MTRKNSYLKLSFFFLSITIPFLKQQKKKKTMSKQITIIKSK